MPKFSLASATKLATAHVDLQEIFNKVILEIDCTVLFGYRDRDEQEDAFRRGATTKHWPDSLHNKSPSLAVDVIPYPVDWKDLARFARFAGYVERVAFEEGVPIRWGGDWNGNYRTSDERLVDMPHFELVQS